MRQPLVERAPDQARRNHLGVPDLAGLGYLLPRQTKIGNLRWSVVGVSDNARPVATGFLNFAPLLRCVVLVGQPALGCRLDFEGVGLRAVGGGNQLIVCALRLGEARGGLGGVVAESGSAVVDCIDSPP